MKRVLTKINGKSSAPPVISRIFDKFGEGFKEPIFLQPPPSTSRLQLLKHSWQINQALTLLERWELGKLDPLLYRALIRLCAESKALPEAQRLHSHIAAFAADNRFLLTELVYMYGQCGSVTDARATFESIKDPDVWSYNCLLTAYALNGHLHAALDLFERMPEKNIVSWNTTLKAFITHGFYEDAKDLFLEMPDRNAVSWNIMLTAYAQNGQFDHVLFLLQEIPERSIVTWNIVISAFASSGDLYSALYLFRNVLLEGMHPVNGTFFPVLHGLGTHLDMELDRYIKDGKQIHVLLSETTLSSNLHLMNAVLTMYTKSRRLSDCIETLHSMVCKDVATWTSMVTAYAQSGDLGNAIKMFDKMSFRDEKALSAMMVAYAQHGHLHEARSLFEEMSEKTKEDYSELITAYGASGDIVGAEALFDSMPGRDEKTLNSMVFAYAHSGHLQEAVILHGVITLEGFQPSGKALIAIFNACSKNRDGFLHGRLIHHELANDECTKNEYVQEAILKMHSEQGSFVETCSVFSKMHVRNSAAWGVLISGYVRNGFPSRAIALFHFMNLDGVLPEGTVFLNVLSACKNIEECRGMFGTMIESFGVEPTVDHYDCMVHLLRRAKCPGDADELAKNMSCEVSHTQ